MKRSQAVPRDIANHCVAVLFLVLLESRTASYGASRRQGYLEPRLQWRDDELWREADPRHVEKLLEDIGLVDCRLGV